MSDAGVDGPVAWLRQRWRGRDRFVVLSCGANGIAAFVAAWQAWQHDAERCARLYWIAVGSSPAAEDDASSPGEDLARRALFGRLQAAWPPPTRNLHRLAFDAARVQLLVAPGDAADWPREIVARVDAFLVLPGSRVLLDRARNAKAFARLAATGALLKTDQVDAPGRVALEAVGFRIVGGGVASAPITARFEPAFAARPAIGRQRPRCAPDRRAVIVGAGLAGCAASWALAEAGWHSLLLDRHAGIAAEASGNPVGLFHGIVNGQDGSHARLLRAAALEAAAAVRTALVEHAACGQADGLLQVADAVDDIAAMRRLLERLALPPGYVEALDARQASARAGLPLERPAWFYPGGGWVDPAGLARAFVARAGAAVEWHGGLDVRCLRRSGHGWDLLDAEDRVVASASTVVLANAGDAMRLLGATWPLEAVRGQLSVLPPALAAGLRQPALPISGAGYAIAPGDGSLIVGATAQAGDLDPRLRSADHRDNLVQLARLSAAFAGIDAAAADARIGGRTAWRWVSRDRLPLIGAVARLDPGGGWAGGASARLDQPRFVEREPGLFVYGALGSRGITWSALGAQILAAAIGGAPAPIEASLLDAVDPARFLVRERRRALNAA